MPSPTYSQITLRELLVAGTGLAVVLLSGAVALADTTFVPFAEVEESITDNARSTGSGEEADLINTLSSGFALDTETKRADISIDYEISRDIYTDNSDLNGNRHKLNSDAAFELVEDWVTLNGRAAISEEQINQTGSSTATERTTSQDTARIFNYGVGPTVAHDIGRWASTELSYEYGVVDSKKTDTSANTTVPQKTTIHDFAWAMDSGPKFSKLTWGLNASFQDVDKEGSESAAGTTYHETNYEGETAYNFTNTVAGTLRIGHDNNTDPTTTDDYDGVYGFIGTKLTFVDKLEATVEVGERFGGTLVEAEVKYTPSSRTSVEFSLGTDVQSEQERIASATTTDADGNLVDVNSSDSEFTELTTKTQTMGLTFNHSRNDRTDFELGLEVQSREFSQDNTEDSTGTLSASVSHLMTRQMTAVVSASYTDTLETRTANSDEASLLLSGSLSYNHSDTLTSSVGYSFLDRREDGAETVQENVLMMTLRKSF
ncbi:TIGR03016 family PEP-CTERM system-associated outer membrane protein [Aestuariispira insulae]|uniref:Uncharacterized protein (PEP-CTERM system associated) n=1 Tax=Aestuariispira insulae TaxID=1461337 RepID=A0A3D9HK23_9PROT|nr:TIGR03016 family PEP-CTERM system-associated outer membrane protein [Aestuariispira insulae]RED49862.1 uncharacterized protein (PEP-CTERM system associated) [Aestuariispira insulae]